MRKLKLNDDFEILNCNLITVIRFSIIKSNTSMNSTPAIVGYMHIVIETIKAEDTTTPVHAHISIGEMSKVDTSAKASGSIFN